MNAGHTRLRSALADSGWLTAATLAVWLLLVAPAWALAGLLGLEGLSYAALICLVPGWLVFLMTAAYGFGTSQGAVVVLSGTGVRMAFVLGGALTFRALRPDFGFREFYVWLVVFYLTTLLLETMLTLRHRPA